MPARRNLPCWGREHERLGELDDMLLSVAVNDLEAPKSGRPFVDRHASRLIYEVVQAFDGDFENVVSRVIGNAENGYPFRGDLVAYR